jgi:signal-transduction protein with cAMP-binding, CBS, and nucleotidyltransferase domain
LHSEGHLNDKMAAELTDAYHVITRQRILLQTKRVKRIIDDDCYLNPYELASSEREELKDAIGSIDELQHMVRSRFAISMSVDRILLPSR